MRFVHLTVFVLSVGCASAFAQEAGQAALGTETSMACEQAITIFHDVSGFGRKDRAAARLTERHDEMALSGWRFADMVVYTENGDLEGFYVSYTRPAPCASEQVAQS